MILMMQNTAIAQLDFSTREIQIFNPEFIPIELQQIKKINSTVIHFLRNRQHILTQQNQQLLLNFKQREHANVDEKLFLSTSFYSTNMTDSFWIKDDDDHITQWEDINPRTHELKDICRFKDQLQLEPQKELANHLEYSQGSYPKMWVHRGDSVYLYKQSPENIKENLYEVCSSDILNHTNLPHVQYKKVSDSINKCQNLANEEYSIVSAQIINSWCNKNNKKFDQLCNEIDPHFYANMIIMDYLLGNTDRTLENIGFYIDNSTGCITGFHPTFDYNNAFDFDRLTDEKCHQLRLQALSALDYCNLKFDKVLYEDSFPDRKSYLHFKNAAIELGIYIEKDYNISLNPQFQSKDLHYDLIHNDNQFNFIEKEFCDYSESFENQLYDISETLDQNQNLDFSVNEQEYTR